MARLCRRTDSEFVIRVRKDVDQKIFVDFQAGNAEMPLVIGTISNTNEKSGYAHPNNDFKAMHTRSGIKMVYNDAEGSVLIEDPSGNTYLMDGKGSITLNAPKNFTVNAGENVSFTAGKNIIISAGENIDNSANKDITQTAEGNINESADNKNEFIEKKYVRNSLESTQHAEEVTIFSTKENMLLESSKKTVDINSAEKSNMF